MHRLAESRKLFFEAFDLGAANEMGVLESVADDCY
jgi:hypothetical protein